MPFALHITWHTYGDWLPGDERGHVSNVLISSGGFVSKQNAPGTPCAPGHASTREQAQSLLKGDRVWLTADQAFEACKALVEAAEKRGWLIVRAAAMANHIHCVIKNCPDDGPAVRRILKGVSQAKLSDFARANIKWWATGGSDRYKHDDAAIEAAIAYVENQQYQLARIVDNVASLVRPAGQTRRLAGLLMNGRQFASAHPICDTSSVRCACQENGGAFRGEMRQNATVCYTSKRCCAAGSGGSGVGERGSAVGWMCVSQNVPNCHTEKRC